MKTCCLWLRSHFCLVMILGCGCSTTYSRFPSDKQAQAGHVVNLMVTPRHTIENIDIGQGVQSNVLSRLVPVMYGLKLHRTRSFLHPCEEMIAIVRVDGEVPGNRIVHLWRNDDSLWGIDPDSAVTNKLVKENTNIMVLSEAFAQLPSEYDIAMFVKSTLFGWNEVRSEFAVTYVGVDARYKGLRDKLEWITKDEKAKRYYYYLNAAVDHWDDFGVDLSK